MKLDLGCGPKKLAGFVGMDHFAHDGVDIVHDIETFSWPLEDGSCEHINASHVLEHLKPWMLVGVMNEAWRVLQPGKALDVRTPYGPAFDFDPTHCIRFQESSFLYFDHTTPYHSIYKPKPWKVIFSKRNDLESELRTILKKEVLS